MGGGLAYINYTDLRLTVKMTPASPNTLKVRYLNGPLMVTAGQLLTTCHHDQRIAARLQRC